MGAWATVGDNYASYDPTNGVIANATNIVAGDPTTGALVTDGTSNVRDMSGKNLSFSGNATVNSLIATGDVSLPSGSTLTVNSGGLMFAGQSKWYKGGGSVQVAPGGTQLVVSSVSGDQVGNTTLGGNDHRIQWSIKENGAPLTVIKTGEGHLMLDAVNTYTGGTIINAGALGANQNAALGAITQPVTVRPGGSFDVAGVNQGTREFIVSGSGATMSNGVAAGAVTNFGGGQNNALIKLTLAGDAAVGGTGRWDLRTNGTNGAVLNGGTFTLTKVGTNTVSIVQPASVSVGNIVVDGGVLSFENANNVMGSTSHTATVNAGGILQFWNNVTGGISQNKPIVLNGGIVTSENGPTTLTGPVQLAGPASGQLRANNALTVTNVVSGSGGFTKTGGNTLLFSANSTYSGPTNVNAGLFRVTGSIANSAVTVNSTGTFEAPVAQRVAGLTVNTGGLTTVPNAATPYALTVGSGTSATSPFSIPGTGSNAGKVELNKNGMIVDVAAGGEVAAVTSVRTAVLAAYNGGQWNGAGGLTSSQISGSNRLAIGFGTPADVSTVATNGGTQFFGSAIDASSVVVQTTIGGDANLDKTVNFGDLLVLAKNYNSTTAYWAKGDFNYDGTVNFGDLLTLAKNYNASMPTEPVPGASAQFEADMAAAFAAVPEPGSLALLGLGVGAMLGGRRRRARKC
jgi:autotransporter-associated beta strand protein